MGRLRPADPNEKQPRRSATESPRVRALEGALLLREETRVRSERGERARGRGREGTGLELVPVMRWGGVIR